ncbi:MAG: twin-arginine translocase TatA/TatE family subunit [Bacteroidetes bacterium]|nr:MAG: twin-arginine translocase TatA/TatE family subunit [Bacteroidota bacterium]
MLLFLNDVSGSEILLILVFILMFFGSKSIPGLARTLGRTMRQIKDASSELQQEIKKSGMDIKKDLNLTGIVEETARDIQRPLDQYASDIDEAMRYESPKKTPLIEVKEEKIEPSAKPESPSALSEKAAQGDSEEGKK